MVCIDGIEGVELSCHKQNNTEDPSHVKGVVSAAGTQRE